MTAQNDYLLSTLVFLVWPFSTLDIQTAISNIAQQGKESILACCITSWKTVMMPIDVPEFRGSAPEMKMCEWRIKTL